jgi:hypothetical protein
MKQESAPIRLKGQKEWPPEWESFRDERTGARITRLTGFRCINHPLYYLTNSFTRDGKWMVFASDRAGRMDLYRVSLGTGLIQRLTNLAGLQPFSGNVVDDEVYFSTAGRMHRLNLEDGTETVLADCPGANFGEVTVSCDRKWAAALITRNDVAGILITPAIPPLRSGSAHLLRGSSGPADLDRSPRRNRRPLRLSESGGCVVRP